MIRRIEAFWGGIKETARWFDPNIRAIKVIPVKDGGSIVFYREGFSDDCELEGEHGLTTVFIDGQRTGDFETGLINLKFEPKVDEEGKPVFNKSLTEGSKFCEFTVREDLLDKKHAAGEVNVGILAVGNDKAFVRQKLDNLLQIVPTIRVIPMSVKRWWYVSDVLDELQRQYLERTEKQV